MEEAAPATAVGRMGNAGNAIFGPLYARGTDPPFLRLDGRVPAADNAVAFSLV